MTGDSKWNKTAHIASAYSRASKSQKYLDKRRINLEGDSMKNEKLFDNAPDVLKLIAKLIRFRKGGYTKAEREELGEDLLDLALDILQSID